MRVEDTRERGRSPNKPERITFRASGEHLDDLGTLVEDGPYPNQSEAIRSAIESHASEFEE